jgi:hypothetical protein
MAMKKNTLLFYQVCFINKLIHSFFHRGLLDYFYVFIYKTQMIILVFDN